MTRRRHFPAVTRKRALTTGLAIAALAAGPAAAFQTEVEPFYIDPPAEPGDQPYELTPLLSVADQVPRTTDDSQNVQMLTIPDGLGALSPEDLPSGKGDGFVAPGSDFALFMNQEHNSSEESEFVIDEPKYNGATISLFQMSAAGEDTEVDSGDLAYDRVFDTEAGKSHPPSRTDNDPGHENAFARFCSGYLAYDYERYGFDRPIYFTGEETSGNSSYDGRGGIATATFEHDGQNELHTLPGLGHMSFENVVPVAGYRGQTVLMGLEDGPADDNGGYDSQLYMYIGRQQPNATDPMRRNGLVGGRLYVLALRETADGSERTFERGKRPGRWVAVQDQARSDAASLEAYAQSVDAFDFYRIEDGDAEENFFVFDTTGGDDKAPYPDTRAQDQPGNYYGRLYALRMNRGAPSNPAQLSLEYDADEAVATQTPPNRSDGNALVSPDNLSLSPQGLLMVQEDATGYGDEFMAEQGRDAQIWRFEVTRKGSGRFDVRGGGALPVAESECIYDGGRDNLCGGNEVTGPDGGDPPEGGQGNGTWESSGIIDTDHVIGANTFLFDVQAHSEPPPTSPFDYGRDPEDGQLMLMTPREPARDREQQGKGKSRGGEKTKDGRGKGDDGRSEKDRRGGKGRR